MVNILPELSKFIKDNNKPGVCIKFTLGKYTDNFGFESHLFNESNYKKIKSSLDSYEEWKETYEEIHTYIDEHPSKIINSIIIINDGPYDIFVSAETEDKVDISDPNKKEINVYTYVWRRHNFVLKNYSFNIGDPLQKLEIYITDNNVCEKYLAHSSLLKIKDFMNLFENGEWNEDLSMKILQKK